MGITSRRVQEINGTIIHKNLLFFSQFLPSFCNTSSSGFKYHFYIAFDYNDYFFQQETFLIQFTSLFYEITLKNCPDDSSYKLHFVQCSHSKSPARAQNDAMMIAYMSNMAYFYRINDDTVMTTPNWTTIYIKTLSRMHPPYVGVIGPFTLGEKSRFLTYEFVSYIHFDIFGFYYPHYFIDACGDTWISSVYLPGRSYKLKEVKLLHTKSLGKRYGHPRNHFSSVRRQVKKHQPILTRWVKGKYLKKALKYCP